jgi:hypothetical protein
LPFSLCPYFFAILSTFMLFVTWSPFMLFLSFFHFCHFICIHVFRHFSTIQIQVRPTGYRCRTQYKNCAIL